MKKRIKSIIKKIVPWTVQSWIKECIMSVLIKRILKRKDCVRGGAEERGVNLIGGIKAEMGLGQSCRLVAKEVLGAKERLSVFNADFAGEIRQQDSTYDQYLSESLPYAINLFHVNPCELSKLLLRKEDMWSGHYNIAFWLWELEEFPKEWIKYCELFDEIWTPSDFAGSGIRKVTSVPVKTMPYSVVASDNQEITRKDFGLPEDKFLFLVMYDLNSTNSRKNPQGALRAYKMAFPEEREDCGIVIKVNNATKKNIDMLRKELEGYHNVYFITEVMDKIKVNSLIRSIDVFVSLHRAEGFGLVMAEAMLLGVPVVTTNWSSNTEFMSEESSCMVGYDFVTIEKREVLYPKGYRWAEPRINEAALFMKKLLEDDEYYDVKSCNGKAYIEQVLGADKISALWSDEIDKCYNKWHYKME